MQSPMLMTRRAVLGGLIGTLGVAGLAACGDRAAPPLATGVVPTTASAARPLATVTRNATPLDTGGTRAGGTATGPARAETADRGGATALLRALALVPRYDPLPGRGGITFADLATHKRNYGLAAATSEAAFAALPDNRAQSAALITVHASLPLPYEASRQATQQPGWRELLAYDHWQIDQVIRVGDEPKVWTRLDGRFDRPALAAAFANAGHRPRDYGGATILELAGDADLPSPLTRFAQFVLWRFNRVVLEEGALIFSPYTALIEAGVDARAGQEASFARDPDYAALAGALGDVVGARLLPAAPLLATPPRPPAQSDPPISAEQTLPPYRLVGLGLRDDGTTHTMVVALRYGDPATARAAAPILRDRAATYRLAVGGEALRDLATIGSPAVIDDAAGATVVLPLAIGAGQRISLWEQLWLQGEYRFLAERLW